MMMLGAGMAKKKTGTHVRRRDDRLHDVPFGVKLKYDDDDHQ
jgi:hypothetical protein